ncbi:MAG TPA: PfkB family carbohydrate kinase [Candidatus Binataceae bacterium]|nr:PfkB family carbohydrate kinase [Candidatus Binataceae bacterium]
MTIAGSDPIGGAGIQADLKSFAACGVHGVTVITAIIAQNSSHVGRILPVSPAMVRAQIEMLTAESPPAALKTGALATAAIVRCVAGAIAAQALPAPVIDPVMLSTSGARLLDREGEEALRSLLLPLARVITPNLPEAAALSGIAITTPSAIREAVRVLHRLGARAVVIKGGHSLSGAAAAAGEGGAGARMRARAALTKPRDGAGTAARSRPIPLQHRLATDLFYDGRRFIELTAPRIPGDGAHGTGCAFSAALAAWLARGADLERAVREAKRFVTAALKHSYRLSANGRPLLGHLTCE